MHKSRVTLIFAGAGLVGPLVWFATWHPFKLTDMFPPSVSFFLTDLVALIWPAAMMGIWMGTPINLALFTMLGSAVAWLARTRSQLAVAYALVGVLVTLMALWLAGFAFNRVDGFALAVALLLYAIPFGIVMRASTGPTSV